MWFFKPEQNQIIDNYKGLVSPILDYLWNSFIIYINVTIYLALVEKGLLANVFIILFGVYVLGFNRPKSSADIKRGFDKAKNWAKDKAKRGIENSTKMVNSYKNRVRS